MSVVAPEPTDERNRRDPGESRAGVFLARLTVAPALLLVCWLAVALPLLMAGVFTPLPAIALFVPVAALVLTFGLLPLIKGAVMGAIYASSGGGQRFPAE